MIEDKRILVVNRMFQSCRKAIQYNKLARKTPCSIMVVNKEPEKIILDREEARDFEEEAPWLCSAIH